MRIFSHRIAQQRLLFGGTGVKGHSEQVFFFFFCFRLEPLRKERERGNLTKVRCTIHQKRSPQLAALVEKGPLINFHQNVEIFLKEEKKEKEKKERPSDTNSVC